MPELAPEDMPLDAPELIPEEAPEVAADELPPPELLMPDDAELWPLLDGVSLGVLDGVCVVPGVLLVNAPVV